MKKLTALILGIFLLLSGLVFAETKIEVGNKICPVSGEKVGEMGPPVKHEYNGKVYNFCCAMCPPKFDKDPAKYAKIAEDEVAKAPSNK